MKTEIPKDCIGVFDSGVGGLSILRQLIKDFPEETFVYLGDTARLPYGAKSKETIKNYVLKNIDYLNKNYSLKAVVVACPSLVTLVEEGSAPHPLLSPAFDFYLSQFKNLEKMDTLILGCTHFPFFKKELETHLKSKNLKIKLTDASEEISLQLKALIADKIASEKSFLDQILVTDDASHFKDFVSQNLPEHRAFEFQKIDL